MMNTQYSKWSWDCFTLQQLSFVRKQLKLKTWKTSTSSWQTISRLQIFSSEPVEKKNSQTYTSQKSQATQSSWHLKNSQYKDSATSRCINSSPGGNSSEWTELQLSKKPNKIDENNNKSIHSTKNLMKSKN